MNSIVIFILVIAMYFRLNETARIDTRVYRGCPTNIIEIQNQLGPARALEYFCYSQYDELYGFIEFNTTKPIKFGDSVIERTWWMCELKQGLWMNYSQKFEAYRGASDRQCDQVRKWIAKVDGIYFERNRIKPSARALQWIKK